MRTMKEWRDLLEYPGGNVHVYTILPEGREEQTLQEMLTWMDDHAAALAEKEAELTKTNEENERLRVQLAGCGVAADQNTEASRQERVKPYSYGWSASYQAVCDAVDREIALRAERDLVSAEVERLRGKIEFLTHGPLPRWVIKELDSILTPAGQAPEVKP